MKYGSNKNSNGKGRAATAKNKSTQKWPPMKSGKSSKKPTMAT